MSDISAQGMHRTTLVDVKDAARQLGVSPMSVRRWIDQGRLPSVKLGDRLIRIRTNDLEDFINGKQGQEETRPKDPTPEPATIRNQNDSPEMSLDGYLTTSEVAKLSGLTADSISKLVRRGKLKGKKNGKCLIFEREEINAWLKERLIGSPTTKKNKTGAQK